MARPGGGRTVLLGTESPRDGGHAVRLRRLAALLREAGWCARVVRPPGWDVPPLPPHRGAIGSFADVLHGWGLGDAERVRAGVGAWWRVLAAALPDVVLADAAPHLVLACRDRFPVVVAGNGFFAPPAGLDAFPRLPGLPAPAADEGALRDVVNAVLRGRGAPEAARLSDALAGDAQAPTTDPRLDPYRVLRTGTAVGPLLPPLPDARGRATFLYLSDAAPPGVRAVVARAFARLPGPRRAVVPAGGEAAALLARSGCVVETARVPPADIVRHARVIVHLGTHGMASLGLAAGLPQVALPTDAEKRVTATLLERAGVAAVMPVDDAPPVEAVLATLARASGDAPLAARARAAVRPPVGTDAAVPTLCDRLAG